ncbi:uncharacterized protein LOC118199894, partial [Stegodyphus dumicola]|uniref:uncharacterized protein LOC118199894 n=1 Tax=Stegodyphus dumicola TaxID=202533 RepID=UPI0015ACB72A
MRRTAAANWGVSSQMLKIWYVTVAERIALHGVSIWGVNVTINMQHALNSEQRPFLLGICRGFRTSPTTALNVLTGLPPLHLIVQSESVVVRVIRIKQDVTIWSKTYVFSDYENHISHSPCHSADFDIEANCNPPSALQSLAVYTDGSKGELGTCSAWYAMEGDHIIRSWAKKLHLSNSVFQAELTALKAALDFTANNSRYKVIYTDSMSSLQAIQGGRSRHLIVRDIQKLLISIPASLRLELQWVPAHTGIKGNEAADMIAKDAANEPH